MTSRYDAVVLAGGAASRLGGADKPALSVGGRLLLDRVLAACEAAARTVVVGPRRPTGRPVRWTREQPAGGGPLPALAAGLAALDEAHRPAAGAPARPEVVLVLAADLPFLTADTAGALADALTSRREGPATATAPDTSRDTGTGRGTGPGSGRGTGTETTGTDTTGSETTGTDTTGTGTGAAGGATGGLDAAATTPWEGVMLTDSRGRDQPLAAAYRIEPLRRELALLAAEHGSLSGLPLRFLTGELALLRIADPTGDASFDCDTWEDVAVARARLHAESEG